MHYRIRLPVDSECAFCECISEAHTVVYTDGERMFCTQEHSVTYQQRSRRLRHTKALTRTDQILDLCSYGYGLLEAVEATAHRRHL